MVTSKSNIWVPILLIRGPGAFRPYLSECIRDAPQKRTSFKYFEKVIQIKDLGTQMIDMCTWSSQALSEHMYMRKHMGNGLVIVGMI